MHLGPPQTSHDHPQVTQGTLLIAELLRLSVKLPADFQGRGPLHYSHILFDFGYLKDPESHERRIEADRKLVALDDAFREVLWRGEVYNMLPAILQPHNVQQAVSREYMKCSKNL